MDSHYVTNGAPKQPANGGPMPSHSNSLDTTKRSPKHTDPEIDAINKHILAACQTIDSSRRNMWNKMSAAASIQQELNQEQKLRLEAAEAYKYLHNQYGKTLTDLHMMSSKCCALHKQLDDAQRTISAYKSIISDYEQRLNCKVEHNAIKTDQLEARIKEFEEEKAAADRNVDELVNNKEKEHQFALAVAADRIAAAEQKVGELEQNLTSVTRIADSISETSGKRQRSEDELHESLQPAKRGRKRRLAVVDSNTVYA